MQQLDTPGSMLAVRATSDDLTGLLAAEPRVAVAAINGARDLVLSGAADAVERIGSVLRSAGVAVHALAVSHAFHSPLMNPRVGAFADVAASYSGKGANSPHPAGPRSSSPSRTSVPRNRRRSGTAKPSEPSSSSSTEGSTT